MAFGIVSVPFTLGISVIGPWVYQATFPNTASKLNIIRNETLSAGGRVQMFHGSRSRALLSEGGAACRAGQPYHRDSDKFKVY